MDGRAQHSTAAQVSRGRAASSPSPLVGEGRGGGSGGFGTDVPHGPTPTPDPSPQGGGEQIGAASATFAANRAVGRVSLVVAATPSATRRTKTREDGSLRVRFPNACAGAAEAVLVNTAGGLTGGDRFAIDLALDAGAQLTVNTAAAEKIYRSLGP